MNALSNDDDTTEPGGPRRLLVRAATGLCVIGALAGGVVFLLRGDADPPRRVNELQVMMITPPPPPPPPPPETKTDTPPPEQQKFEEQKPIKDEIEDKPVDLPKEAAVDPGPAEVPGPPDLGLNSGPGTGGLAQGRGSGGLGGGGSGRFAWYASLVQAQMQSALQANEKTRYATLQLIVRLWLDETGRVSRVVMNQSTGDSALDAAIREETLGRLQLREPPPRDMPMPIVLRMSARNV